MSSTTPTKKALAENVGGAVVPPHSSEAEQSILGALLLDPEAFDRVSDIVKPEHWYHPEHRAIWTTIAGMMARREPVDVVTVFEAGEHDLRYLSDLVNSVPGSTNIRRYAEIVRDRWLARELVKAAADIAADAADLSEPPRAKIDRAATRLTALGEERAEQEPVGVDEALVSFMDHLQAEADGKSRIFPTGLADLDELMNGGLREGELVVIGARPKMGKTALMLSMQRSCATKYHVGVLSQEMPKNELVARHVAAVGRIELSRLRRPDPRDDRMWYSVVDANEALAALNMAFDDTRGLTLFDVRRKAMQMKRRRGLDVLMVDFLQLMVGDGGDNRNQELDRIANGLKALAGELNIAIVLLSQLSRDADKRGGPPVMTDLRDSGAIEAAADIIMLMYREAAHPLGQRTSEWEHHAQLEVIQRNGSPGRVDLWFDGPTQRFENWQGPPPVKIGKGKGYSGGGLS